MIKKCETCNKEYCTKPCKAERSKYCSYSCRANAVRGKIKTPNHKIKRYRTTKINGVPMLGHRYVMQSFIGRPLSRGELVHHINGDKADNRIENLMIMTPKEHSVHHNQKYPLTKLCVICGSEFMPHPTKRKRSQSCSQKCHFENLSRLNKSRSSSDKRSTSSKASGKTKGQTQ